MFSLYTGLTIEDSYIGLGIGILVFFSFFGFFITAKYKEKNTILNLFFYLLLSVSLFIFCLSFYWRSFGPFLEVPHIYHEEIFIPCIGAIAIMFRKKMFFLRFFIFIFLLSTPLLSWKLTGFIAFYVTALYSVFLAFIKIKRFNKFISIAFISPFLSIGLVISSYIPIAFFQYRKLFPSGHTEERIFSYSIRLHQFYENFLFGNFFYGYKYLDYGWAKRASHSDILDFLAMGGVLGFILLFLGLN